MLSVGATFNGILQPEIHPPTLGLMGLAWAGALLVLARRGLRLHRSAWDVVLLGWALVIGLSLLANFDSVRRIGIGLWYIALYVGVWYLVTELLAQQIIRRETLLDALLMAGVVILIFGYVQMAVSLGQGGGIPRLVSTLGNANALGAVLVVLLPLVCVRAWMVKAFIPRAALVIYAVLTLALLVMTGSRGAYLGAFAGLALLGGLLAFQAGRWARRAILAAGGGLILVGAGLAVFLVQSLNAPGRGADLRTFIYEAAWQVFTTQPLTGSGLFTFGAELMRIESSPPAQVHSHAHNVVLHIMAELGLPGLAMLILTLALGGWMARRNWRGATPSTRLILMAGMSAVVGFGVHHLLDLPAMMPAVALTGLIAWIITVAPLEPVPIRARWRSLAQGFGLLAVFALLINTAARSSQDYAAYVGALRLASQAQAYRAAADALTPVIVNDPLLTLYSYEQGLLYGMAAAAGDEAALDDAIEAYDWVASLEPGHAAALTNLSALFWQAGESSQALETLDRALAVAPESWQIALLRRRYAIEDGDAATADAMTARIAQLNPDALLLPELGQRPEDTAALSVPARFSLRLAAGDAAGARQVWSGYEDAEQARGLALSAVLVIAEGNADAAARLTAALAAQARTPAERAWLGVVQARTAADPAQAAAALDAAWAALAGDPLAADWAMGINYGYAQFLRLMLPRHFVPQVGYVADDPILLFWMHVLEGDES